MITVGTFNCENLFARYRFQQGFDPLGADGFTINNLAFGIYDETSKQITAAAIKEIDADILALQEVESLPVLDRFNSVYLAAKQYKYRIVIDAFDPRKIDVAILSKHPIVKARSYRHERNKKNTTFVFSRDCLEVEIDVDGTPLTLYVNHFKSMIPKRSETKARRQEQVEKVADIVKDRWKADNYQGNFIVLGDFNDYVDAGTSLKPLVNHPGLDNVATRIKAKDRWTHYWHGGGEYRQLDYILLSKSLAQKNANAPQIYRKGLPWRATAYAGDRLSGVGDDYPKASDHCPMYMTLDLS